MLGIGFIITHFVAMQKPQQRKYHSSCERSVHRGIAHGKQRVKFCKRKTPHLFLMRSFLPPCGDKLQFSNNIIDSKIMRLSSPCGDKLQFSGSENAVKTKRLSSPCGDKLQFHTTVNSDNGTELSSPCGDKLQSFILYDPKRIRKFPSPCGDKLQCLRKKLAARRSCYRPLAGISCNLISLSIVMAAEMLSSPCGDKLQWHTGNYRNEPRVIVPLRG